jgi:hypothetical protein
MKEIHMKEGHLLTFNIDEDTTTPTREWDVPTLLRFEKAIENARKNGLDTFGFLHDRESADVYDTKFAAFFAQWLRQRLIPTTFSNRTAA